MDPLDIAGIEPEQLNKIMDDDKDGPQSLL